MSASELPLSGMRVVDLSRVLAGPYCGMILSMLGADVIKVEDKAGDESRQWPPIERDLGTPYISMNLNKRGIVVDLKAPEGQQIIKDLAAGADVLIENFKTGTMEKFGLGYEDLKPLNPRLVYTSISAFGRVGPRAEGLGYEALMQAYSGPMSMTGMPDGEPVRCGVSFLDMSTGISSALATVTALLQRAQTGKGALVQASLLNTALGLMTYQMANFTLDGAVPARLGSAHPMVVPYQAFPTADGHIFIASGNQNLYERLCKALEREDLIADERFKSNSERVRHRDDLLKILFEVMGKISTDELMKRFDTHGVPCTRVNNIRDLMADGQVDAIGALLNVDGGDYGPLKLMGLPFAIQGLDNSTAKLSPRLGEHTREILREAGYSDEAITALLEKNIVTGK